MNRTKTMVYTALFAALIAVATAFLKVPMLYGYVNLGDGVIFAASILLGAPAFFAASIGSALADIISGYAIYAPATFIIKGLMALAVCYFFSRMENFSAFKSLLIFILGETIMIAGYFIFETVLYGSAAAAMNILANSIQAGFGLAVGMIIAAATFKMRMTNRFFLKQ